MIPTIEVFCRQMQNELQCILHEDDLQNQFADDTAFCLLEKTLINRCALGKLSLMLHDLMYSMRAGTADRCKLLEALSLCEGMLPDDVST